MDLADPHILNENIPPSIDGHTNSVHDRMPMHAAGSSNRPAISPGSPANEHVPVFVELGWRSLT